MPMRNSDMMIACDLLVMRSVPPAAFKTFEGGGSGQFFGAHSLGAGAAKEAFGAWHE
jgi:hypothetical protein